VVAYSPFGHDDFPAPNAAQGRVLAEIASAHGATSRQVALSFLARRPSVFAIPKAATAGHAADNAGALHLKLSASDVARIEAAFPRGPEPRSLPML
jgi:diketogulonate reductase-like aldo/keto reductase